MEHKGLNAEFLEGCISRPFIFFEEFKLQNEVNDHIIAIHQRDEHSNFNQTLRVRAYVASSVPKNKFRREFDRKFRRRKCARKETRSTNNAYEENLHQDNVYFDEKFKNEL
eukprot:snap_masked-scaffold_13-processed-gene-11.24-mRNA-1 protein AED:1.00 eAED:1.00 QI:0/-1/0/0/-1/1/1/0/110